MTSGNADAIRSLLGLTSAKAVAEHEIVFAAGHHMYEHPRKHMPVFVIKSNSCDKSEKEKHINTVFRRKAEKIELRIYDVMWHTLRRSIWISIRM